MFISKKKFYEEIEKAKLEGENRCFKRLEEQRFRNDVGRRLYDIEIRLSKIEETPIGEAIKPSKTITPSDMEAVSL